MRSRVIAIYMITLGRHFDILLESITQQPLDRLARGLWQRDQRVEDIRECMTPNDYLFESEFHMLTLPHPPVCTLRLESVITLERIVRSRRNFRRPYLLDRCYRTTHSQDVDFFYVRLFFSHPRTLY